MAKTRGGNPFSSKPSDRGNGSRGKGKGNKGAPPARRSARTNPPPDVVDHSLLKSPPESLLSAGAAATMPSLVALAPTTNASPYPLRSNRTPAANPPAIVNALVNASGDDAVSNLPSPCLPPLWGFGIPNASIHDGQELDFGRGAAVGGRAAEDDCDDGFSEFVEVVDDKDNDDDFTEDVGCDEVDDDSQSDYHDAGGGDDDSKGLDYSSEDDDNNLLFDDDIEAFELVDRSDPKGGKREKTLDRRRYRDGPSPPDYTGMSDYEIKIAKDEYEKKGSNGLIRGGSGE